MDNNSEMPGAGGTPNSEPSQTVEQPVQPMPQQGLDQPTGQAAQPATGTASNPANQGTKKKTGLIIGCVIGVIAIVVAVVVVLLLVLPGQGGERTVSCTTSATTMGIDVNSEANVKIKDGKLSDGNMTINVDLANMPSSYKNYEENLVDSLTSQYEKYCDDDHCVFDYNYTEGDSVKYVLQYDNEGVKEIVWVYGGDNMSTQAVADKVQEALESQNYTCTQY